MPGGNCAIACCNKPCSWCLCGLQQACLCGLQVFAGGGDGRADWQLSGTERSRRQGILLAPRPVQDSCCRLYQRPRDCPPLRWVQACASAQRWGRLLKNLLSNCRAQAQGLRPCCAFAPPTVTCQAPLSCSWCQKSEAGFALAAAQVSVAAGGARRHTGSSTTLFTKSWQTLQPATDQCVQGAAAS
jgi:hypothetical protein